MSISLRLTNTLSGKKEPFVPLREGHVGLYACGVTVYDVCHLGHAMQAILFDVFVRYLRYRGFQVTYVRNFTDVDDKIIARASELGLSPLALSASMIEASRRDFASLGIKPADFEPRVSEYIEQIINFIQKLIDKDFAYLTPKGDVYFRVRKHNGYGCLSNCNLDDLRSSGRIENDSAKEDPLDFVLWKTETVPGACWPSPFGMGRPGWHIECSVMSSEILGDSFDIHGGGRDLVFPHHENEIAQSEAKSGCQYVKYWLHTGLLTVNRQKMSKSLGNFLSIADAVKRYGAELIRWNVFQVHYTSNIDFSDQGFGQGMKRLYYFYRTMKRADDFLAQYTDDSTVVNPQDGDCQNIRSDFMVAMDDDFNLPRALVAWAGAFQKINEILDAKVAKAKKRLSELLAIRDLVRELGDVIGLCQENPADFFDSVHRRFFEKSGLSEEKLLSMLENRAICRSERDFAAADQIRNDLEALGIAVQDTPEGQRYELNDAGLEKIIL